MEIEEGCSQANSISSWKLLLWNMCKLRYMPQWPLNKVTAAHHFTECAIHLRLKGEQVAEILGLQDIRNVWRAPSFTSMFKNATCFCVFLIMKVLTKNKLTEDFYGRMLWPEQKSLALMMYHLWKFRKPVYLVLTHLPVRFLL